MNVLKKYFNYRQALIDQYIRGDMTKREYLNRNLDAVLALNIKPFKNVDTVDKGLFNYQYYNAMAKDAKMEAYKYADKERAGVYNEKSNHYYYMKDKSTLRVLSLLNFIDVKAYFIKVRSKELKNKLFEIVIENDGSSVILHSRSSVILNRLREENCFVEGVKHSLIDTYINHRY